MPVWLQVLEDLEAALGPLPPRQQLAYDAITEVYSSDRAMLACLPRELLDQVSCAAMLPAPLNAGLGSDRDTDAAIMGARRGCAMRCCRVCLLAHVFPV